jgi:hypothetical protein
MDINTKPDSPLLAEASVPTSPAKAHQKLLLASPDHPLLTSNQPDENGGWVFAEIPVGNNAAGGSVDSLAATDDKI